MLATWGYAGQGAVLERVLSLDNKLDAQRSIFFNTILVCGALGQQEITLHCVSK